MQVLSGRELFEPTIQSSLRAIRFLRHLEEAFPEEYSQFLRCTYLWGYQQGAAVMQAGDSAGSLFLVVSGTVVVRGSNSSELASITAGEWLGDMSLFNLRTRTANVTVESKTARLLMIPKNIMQPDDMTFSTEFKRFFYDALSKGIRWKLEQARMKHPSEELKASLMKLSHLTANNDIGDWRLLLSEMSTSLLVWNSSYESGARTEGL